MTHKQAQLVAGLQNEFERLIGRENAGRFTVRLDAQQRRFDCLLYFRRAGLAEETHVGSKVGRADEDAVDAIDRGDLVKGGKAGAAFDLQQQADLVVGRLQVIRDAVEGGRPRKGRAGRGRPSRPL